MFDRFESDDSGIDEQHAGQPSSGTAHKSPSIFSLLLLSILNIVCLALVTHHFTAHANHPTPKYEMRSVVHEMQLAPTSPQMAKVEPVPESSTDPTGNIELAMVSRHVLQVASGFDPPQVPSAKRLQVGSGELSELEPSERELSTGAMRAPAHWVQLGALSKEATARRFWSGLKTSHAALLRDRTPRIFGPAEVGGSFYHLRVGPMPDGAADRLCKELNAAGADCFCIGPTVDRS
ncbi:MAG: SPOR domain-containing protein [Pseudomonadota bacterium]